MKCVYEALPGNSFSVGIYYTQAVQVTIGLRRFHPSVPSRHIISSSWKLSAWSKSFSKWLCPHTGPSLKTKPKKVGEGRQKFKISPGVWVSLYCCYVYNMCLWGGTKICCSWRNITLTTVGSSDAFPEPMRLKNMNMEFEDSGGNMTTLWEGVSEISIIKGNKQKRKLYNANLYFG